MRIWGFIQRFRVIRVSQVHTWALVRGHHPLYFHGGHNSSYFCRVFRVRGPVWVLLASPGRNLDFEWRGWIRIWCYIGRSRVAMVSKDHTWVGSCAPVFVFSAVIRLYKSFARKPWLNGLPRASRTCVLNAWGRYTSLGLMRSCQKYKGPRTLQR